MKTLGEIDNIIEKCPNDFFFPKIIHQVWLTDTGKSPPIAWEKASMQWQTLHPGWIYIRWTNEIAKELISTLGEKFIKCYNKYPYLIQRCEAVRYAALYRYGGMYVDMDTCPRENIEKHFNHKSEVWLCKYYYPTIDFITDYMSKLNNDMMIAQPKSKFFEEMLNEIQKPSPWWALGKVLNVSASIHVRSGR